MKVTKFDQDFPFIRLNNLATSPYRHKSSNPPENFKDLSSFPAVVVANKTLLAAGV
jgi:hypothetical protein